MARIAHNRCISHVVRNHKAARTAELSDDLPSPVDNPEQSAINADRREQLLAAIRGLPLAYRVPVTFAVEGFPPAEIAELVGISVNAVAVRLTETAPLMRMIDVSVAQARRRQRDSRAGYVGSVVLVIAGALISYIWRLRLHLPGTQAMLLMAACLVIAMALCLQGHYYVRKSRDMEARFQYLKRALSASNE